MDAFSKRLSPEFWDSIRRTSTMMNSMQQSVLAANRFWQDNSKLFSPALMESVNRISRITSSIPSTLAPALAEFGQISERINRSFLPAAQEIALMQNKWKEALQPFFETLNRVDPTETQLFNLAETLQIQIDILKEMSPDDQPDVGLDDEEAAANAVNEVLSQPDNWEQVLVQKLNTAKERHPVYAWLIVQLVVFIIQLMIAVLGGLLVETIKPAILRESPSQDAPIVINIDASQQITIINEVPYYYQAEYIETDTGEKHTGWISKRSTKPINMFEEE